MSAKLVVLIVCAVAHLTLGLNVQQQSSNFARDLFLQIARKNIDRNIIISPLSVRAALGVTYLGANGETAEELVQVLNLPVSDKIKVGEYFLNLLRTNTGDVQLNVANQIFLNSGYTLRPSFHELALKYFNTNTQIVNFGQRQQAVDIINSWVNQRTNSKIQKIVERQSIDDQTAAIIANAVYLKGSWKKAFSQTPRPIRPFYTSQTNSIEAETMYVTDQFLYADLPELDAIAVQLPYKNSDLSLTVILPNEINGLANLERKLESTNINNLLNRLSVEDVQVILPKFNIESNVELKEVLKELGIRSIFSNSANLNGLIQSGPPLKISAVLQKAIIEVDKKGIEVVDSIGLQTGSQSTRIVGKSINVDHPFVIVVNGPKGVYLVGHVVSV